MHMPKAIAVLEVDKPHFTITLYENLLKIDLKGSFKNEIEEALENKPILKETIGSVLGMFVPLHIRLNSIDSVHMDETGKIKVKIPFHRNIVIPLERKDGERLVDMMRHLITKAKKQERERIMRRRAKNLRRKSKRVHPSSYGTVPYYFPTEQVDIVGKLRPRKKTKKK